MDIIWSGTLREKLDLKHPFLFLCPTFYTHKHTPIHTPFSSTRHNPPFLWHSSLFFMLNPQLLNWHFCGLSRFSVTSHILLLQCLLYTQSSVSSCSPSHTPTLAQKHTNLLPSGPTTQPGHSTKKAKPTPCHIPESALWQDMRFPHDNYMVVQ